MRLLVGADQPVAYEIAVGGHIRAEITSVGPVCTAEGVFLQQPLVDPVPDVAALQVRVSVDGLPLSVEIPRGVTHGVGIFRRHNRTVGSLTPDLPEPGRRGVLRYEHVRVPLPQRPFVADRTLHQTAVEVFEHRVGVVEIVAVPGLVPQRPDRHRRVVLVALEHVAHTVEVGGQPVGVVAQRSFQLSVQMPRGAFPHIVQIAFVIHAVRFDVGLVVDVKPVFVAQLVEAALLRVVGQPHRVDVVETHQFEITPQIRFRDVMPG